MFVRMALRPGLEQCAEVCGFVGSTLSSFLPRQEKHLSSFVPSNSSLNFKGEWEKQESSRFFFDS